ncbi:hypothetical protein O0L34_g193 [Tuta absoluta]|nr:hypothetical protein O0L34_g193 [Tuta absoluta]
MDSNPALLPEGILVGIGNPLLDISAVVDDSLLSKYELNPDDAIMAEEKHMPLYKELMENYKADFIAGGSVQNSLRVAQWFLKKPHICTYMGCVGEDDYAKILKEKAQSDGVNVLYQVRKNHPTGTCGVLVTGIHRSLCANLAAAQKFTEDHLDLPECKAAIEKGKFFYTSGFFIAVSPASILRLAAHAHAHGHYFVLNLSAPFVMQFFKEPLQQILPYADVVFGNELECSVFAKEFGYDYKNMEDIALKIAAYPKKNPARPRVMVCTQGADPVILVEGDKVQHIPVEKLELKDVVDTNGAGDAFVGGFLSQMVQGKSYALCCRCGIFAARHVIQHNGCTFEGEAPFSEMDCRGVACAELLRKD